MRDPLIVIVSFLDLRSLANLRRVCSAVRRTCKREYERLKIRLIRESALKDLLRATEYLDLDTFRYVRNRNIGKFKISRIKSEREAILMRIDGVVGDWCIKYLCKDSNSIRVATLKIR